MRLKQGIQRPGDKKRESDSALEIIDVMEDEPKKNPWPEVICEPFDDGWPGYDEPCVAMN
ncbi:MAG: hypothetical protein ACYTBP_09120 [Planctomycetota bacterium]|jgi:hypothetical protein